MPSSIRYHVGVVGSGKRPELTRDSSLPDKGAGGRAHSGAESSAIDNPVIGIPYLPVQAIHSSHGHQSHGHLHRQSSVVAVYVNRLVPACHSQQLRWNLLRFSNQGRLAIDSEYCVHEWQFQFPYPVPCGPPSTSLIPCHRRTTSTWARGQFLPPRFDHGGHHSPIPAE